MCPSSILPSEQDSTVLRHEAVQQRGMMPHLMLDWQHAAPLQARPLTGYLPRRMAHQANECLASEQAWITPNEAEQLEEITCSGIAAIIVIVLMVESANLRHSRFLRCWFALFIARFQIAIRL